MATFVDTNVIVYAFDVGDGDATSCSPRT